MKYIVWKKGLFLNHKLENFKNFNTLGVKRSYRPSKKRILKFLSNNEWESDDNKNVFTLRDYKACYITIMKNKQGKYEPRINGSSVSDYPHIIELEKEYSNLDDAKNSAILFVDQVTSNNK